MLSRPVEKFFLWPADPDFPSESKNNKRRNSGIYIMHFDHFQSCSIIMPQVDFENYGFDSRNVLNLILQMHVREAATKSFFF